MCLSTAYKNNKDEDAVIARYVSKIDVKDSSVILTDVMGTETEVPGTLSFIDLTGGTVIIKVA
jgi:predicted RNA-binding protein